MLGLKVLPVLVFAAVVAVAPAAAESPQAAQPDVKPKEGEGKGIVNLSLSSGQFDTGALAGDAINEFRFPIAGSAVSRKVVARIVWKERAHVWPPRSCETRRLGSPGEDVPVVSIRIVGDSSEMRIGLRLPPPPCWLPMEQEGKLTIMALADETVSRPATLFDESVSVTVFWLPLLLTLIVLAVIYPGCALIYGYMRQRNHRRRKSQLPETEWANLPDPPSLLACLDPVQITANPWGRASLGKLQIFMFTLIVFGLLLFYLLRSSVLAALSTDIMLLMGISAVGAAGGKIAYTANRRLSLQNWAWLIRHGWLPKHPDARDIATRAKWSELFLDSETEEFDPYSFQMAIFSLIVALALARTGLSGLGTFKIPTELLALLGISQAVFIGGKAIDTGGYRELGEKLDEVRRHELNVVSLDAKKDGKQEVMEKEKDALRESVAQAAQMFMEVYRKQLQGQISDLVEEAARNGTVAHDIVQKPAESAERKPAEGASG
jgi:hypothetical protein